MEYIHTLCVKYGKQVYRIMQNDWQYLIYKQVDDGNAYRFDGTVFHDEVRRNASAKRIISAYLEV